MIVDSLQGRESNEHASISTDIFKEDAFEFDRIASSLFDNRNDNSTLGYTALSDPKYVVEMHKCSAVDGYGGVDPVSGKYVVTYSNMIVNMYPDE